MSQSPVFHIYNASAGSGKTFTLVKEYLKIVLGNDSFKGTGTFAYQKILAITFTNKAAAEMKDRILSSLFEFSKNEVNPMLSVLSEELQVSEEVLSERSAKVLDAILQNYSAFNITTIDSFTYKIVRAFAYDLGLPLNFEVEMDPTQLLSEAIDVLISKIGVDKKLTDVLLDYSIQKIDSDKSWDVSNDLNKVAKILLNEDDALQFRKLENIALSEFRSLDDRLRKEKSKIEAIFAEKGKEGLSVICSVELQYNDFPYSELPKFFEKLINFKEQKKDTIKFSGRLFDKVSSGVLYAASKKKDVKDRIDSITAQLTKLYFEVEQLYNKYLPDYVLMDLVSKSLIPLSVLNNVQKELSKIKEQNNIRFNGEFNQLISDKIKNEPTPFIYERIGEKFQYYFIDEMQDTSLLQWQNLVPLIDNALSQEKGGLMLVGDGKQAIYRWRGGKAEQFIDLANDENPFYAEKEPKSLGVNYRSYSEIINFNNQFFSHISQYLSNEQYRDLYQFGSEQKLNSNIGGYVQFDFVDKYEMTSEEKEIAYPHQVYEIISELDPAFKKSEVCVLVRGNKEGVAIANYLAEKEIKIISSETLLLQNSSKVKFIIELLSYINNPLDLNAKLNALLFLYEFFDLKISKHLFFSELIPLEINEFFNELRKYSVSFDFQKYLKIPFYESIEEIIRAFSLMDSSDAYVQFFLDFVLDFQRKNTNDLSVFLDVWEQKKGKLSVVSQEDGDAVRIMTIHKSKGLEFPVVIFPCDLNIYRENEPKVWYDDLDKSKFGDLPASLVSCSSNLAMTGELGKNLLSRRKEELALDNFNLLYVALTRAVEQLYIVTEYKKESKNGLNIDLYSGMYTDFLNSISDNEKSFDGLNYRIGDSRRVFGQENQIENISLGEQSEFISTSWESHDIQIVSNASKNWGDKIDTSVRYGLLVHEMMSKIYVSEDVEKVIDAYVAKGELNIEGRNDMLKLLNNIVLHPLLEKYYKEGNIVVNERAILSENGEMLIPDRLVFNGMSVVIIDYKTGKRDTKYRFQLDNYAKTLKNMGCNVEKKILVYAVKEVVIEEY
jgi:ATP-dependent exoDNAse (exonuclease V) beta subunit